MAVFNEDTRVKIPATIQYMRLGYEYQSLKDTDIDPDTRIFRNRFKPAIEAINGRTFADAEVDTLIAEIHDLLKYSDLGKAFYSWLINPQDRIKLIDFDHPEKNDFAVVNELTFGKDGSGDERVGSFRPDINVLVNGIPLLSLR